jgi:hypothetical protein
MHPDQSWSRLVAPEPSDLLPGTSANILPFFMGGGVPKHAHDGLGLERRFIDDAVALVLAIDHMLLD